MSGRDGHRGEQCRLLRRHAFGRNEGEFLGVAEPECHRGRGRVGRRAYRADELARDSILLGHGREARRDLEERRRDPALNLSLGGDPPQIVPGHDQLVGKPGLRREAPDRVAEAGIEGAVFGEEDAEDAPDAGGRTDRNAEPGHATPRGDAFANVLGVGLIRPQLLPAND